MGQGGGWDGPKLRGFAARQALSQLRSSALDVDVVRIDDLNAPAVTEALRDYEVWRDSPERRAFRELTRAIGDMSVDAVLSPLDGSTALREGRSGSTSAIAMGPPRCFVGPTFAQNWDRNETELGVAPAQAYLVVTVGRDALAPRVIGGQKDRRASQKVDELLTAWERGLGPTPRLRDTDIGLDGFVAVEGALQAIVRGLDHEGCEPVVGITLEGSHYRRWRPEFGRRFVYRKLDGSALVPALGAFLGNLGAGVCVARLPQVIQMAVAAKGLEGRLYAVPLVEEPVGQQPGISKVRVPAGALLRRESDFVDDSPALLCVTSVTEVCVLDRVRFASTLVASSESVIVHAASHEFERREDSFNLARTQFWRSKGSSGPMQLPADEMLQDLRDQIDPDVA